MVMLAQSEGPWFSLEFQAACIEAKQKMEGERQRYTVEDKMRYIQNYVSSVPRLAREYPGAGKDNKGKEFPTWETICKWERKNPDLPEKVRERGFLDGIRPLEAGSTGNRTAVPGNEIPVCGWTSSSPPYAHPAYSQEVMGVMTWLTAPRHPLKPEPFVLNNAIEQLIGVMCQAMFVAMAGWFASQCVKIAMS